MAPETPFGAHPDDELLAALAMDDLEDLAPGDRAHVAGCAQCSRAVDELRQTAVLVRASGRQQLAGPAPHVWQGVLRDVRAEGDPGATASPTAVRTTPIASHRARRSWSRPAVAAAVAVALVLGGAVGALWGRGTAPGPSPAVTDAVLARAELTTVDGGDARGLAAVVRRNDNVELRVWGSDLGGAAGVHEVWLLNSDGKRLVALGLLDEGDAGSFVVPEGLLDEGYVVVDVSLEPDDGNPAHSGDSLARGELQDT